MRAFWRPYKWQLPCVEACRRGELKKQKDGETEHGTETSCSKGWVGFRRTEDEASWGWTNGKADWGVTQCSQGERERRMLNTLYVSPSLSYFLCFPTCKEYQTHPPLLLTHTHTTQTGWGWKLWALRCCQTAERNHQQKENIQQCCDSGHSIQFYSILCLM